MFENNSGLLRIANEADRATVATILFKNGYSVTPRRIKTGSRKAEMYVEYSRPGKIMEVDRDEMQGYTVGESE